MMTDDRESRTDHEQRPGVVHALTPVGDLFASRLFRVPDYQRGYSWESTQVVAFLEDLHSLFVRKHSFLHFTGTVVLSKGDDSSDMPDRLDIVDGQQRITTITMVVAAIMRLHERDDLDVYRHRYLYRGPGGREVPVLELNQGTNDYFNRVVLRGVRTTEGQELLSHVRILDAVRTIDRWLEKVCNNIEDAKIILELLDAHFGVIAYQPDSSSEAGLMFEVINNRGKPLSELEKVKNYLVYFTIKEKLDRLRQDISRDWKEVLKNLSKAHGLKSVDEQTFLRSTVIAYFGMRKTESHAAYNQIKKKFPVGGEEDQWKELDGFIQFLSKASQFYREIHRADYSQESPYPGASVINTQLSRLRAQGRFASVLPIYIAVRALVEERLMNESQMTSILEYLEKLVFRVYMARTGAARSDSDQAALFNIAHEIFCWREDEEESIESKVEEIKKRLSNIAYQYGDIERVVQKLTLEDGELFDFYHWGALKYFLMSYEVEENKNRTIELNRVLKGRQSGKTGDYYSVEHIWARGREIDGDNETLEKDSFYKRRLGNLVLLELNINIGAGKLDVWEKVKRYRGEGNKDRSSMAQVKRIEDDFAHLDSNRKFKSSYDGGNGERKICQELIESNEERLKAFAKSRWAFPGE